MTDSNKNGSHSSGSHEVSLHDLIKSFQNEVKQSDWLKDNTSDKWERENPELAKQYRDAATGTTKTNNGSEAEKPKTASDSRNFPQPTNY